MVLIYDATKGDFGLELSLGPQTEKPADIFQSMASLIRALEEIDRDFSRTIDPALDPYLIVQTLEIGSLRTWFRSVLRGIPDERLNEVNFRRICGGLLVKVKHCVLKWLEGKATITNAAEIEGLRKEITQLKNEADRLRQLPVETPMPLSMAVAAVRRVSLALVPLPTGQTIAFASSEGVMQINRSFSVTDEQIEGILTATHKTERARIALTIKKPDYLGTSMWDMILREHPVKAKIVDANWLGTFHQRRVPLFPGDGLLADVLIDRYFDEDGHEFETKYTLERVHEVVRINGEQLDFLRE